MTKSDQWPLWLKIVVCRLEKTYVIQCKLAKHRFIQSFTANNMLWWPVVSAMHGRVITYIVLCCSLPGFEEDTISPVCDLDHLDNPLGPNKSVLHCIGNLHLLSTHFFEGCGASIQIIDQEPERRNQGVLWSMIAMWLRIDDCFAMFAHACVCTCLYLCMVCARWRKIPKTIKIRNHKNDVIYRVLMECMQNQFAI